MPYGPVSMDRRSDIPWHPNQSGRRPLLQFGTNELSLLPPSATVSLRDQWPRLAVLSNSSG